MRRRAFTMVEMLAVVVLLGIIAAGTAWSLADNAQQRSHADLVAQLDHADEMARAAAARLGRPCILRIDLDQQRVQRVVETQDDQHAAQTTTVRFPHRIESVMVAGAQRHAALVESRSVAITYSTAGLSPSYAVRIVTSGETEQTLWLLVAGLTGQAMVMDNEDEIRDIFETLTPGGPDAD
ncbi:MAG: type II secretion system protein [Phycisphaeraceae bacterium]